MEPLLLVYVHIQSCSDLHSVKELVSSTLKSCKKVIGYCFKQMKLMLILYWNDDMECTRYNSHVFLLLYVSDIFKSQQTLLVNCLKSAIFN